MRPSFCRSCLASIFKFLNFLQAFVGIAIVVYSVWVLDHWYRHDHDAPWFPYSLMGIGVAVCLFTFTGHVAAEAINGCCLCFYALLSTIFLLLEAAIVGYLVLDKQWQKDLPADDTGELGRLRAFIEANIDIFKWVGLSVVVIQALSFLLAIILRAMVSSKSEDYDSEDDSAVVRRPFLNSQYAPNQV